MPELSTEFIEELTKKLRAIGSLKAVGDTWVSFDSSVPPGGVPFCGQTVSRALYADLLTWATAQGKMKSEEDWQAYAAANGGNCPYYSEGDSLTTFRMPCVLGYLRGSSVTTEGGTYKPQKLPNIRALQDDSLQINENEYSGAFKFTRMHTHDLWASGTSGALEVGGYLEFNANLYDDRYEDGADVQPETFHVLVGVYAVGVITNINNTDVSQLQTGLATLEANAVRSVDGVTPVNGNVSMPHWGSPNSEVITITEKEFTAPSDGVFSCYYNVSNLINIMINGTQVVRAGDYPSAVIPCKKGDIISYEVSMTFCCFIKCSM